MYLSFVATLKNADSFYYAAPLFCAEFFFIFAVLPKVAHLALKHAAFSKEKIAIKHGVDLLGFFLEITINDIITAFLAIKHLAPGLLRLEAIPELFDIFILDIAYGLHKTTQVH
jgi:hypothetical protein